MLMWIWGCMVIAFKSTLGALLWIFIIGLCGAFLAIMGITANNPVKKINETMEEWEKNSREDLKTLRDEMDKDLK